MKNWKHDELADDLAIAKGGIPFLNVCLGPMWINRNRIPRADLLVCLPSYRKFNISIYEVKVSRTGFLGEIRSGKWTKYLGYCHRLYFAVPSGILDKREIPDGAGLIVRGEKGWKTIKTPAKRNIEIDRNTLISLVFAKQRRSLRERNLDIVQDQRDHWRWYDYRGRIKSAKLFGKQFSWLHSAAIQFGGIKKATRFLQSEINNLK